MAVLQEHHPATRPGRTGRRKKEAGRVSGSKAHRAAWVAEPMAMPAFVRRAFRGVLRVVAPFEFGPEMRDGLDRVEHQSRVLMRYIPRWMALGLLLVVVAVDWAPILMLKSRRRMQKLVDHDHALAVRVFEVLMHSNLALPRQAMFGIRGVVLPAYYDQPEVHFALGYHPEGWINERIALRRRLMRGESPTPDDMIHPVRSELRP